MLSLIWHSVILVVAVLSFTKMSISMTPNNYWEVVQFSYTLFLWYLPIYTLAFYFLLFLFHSSFTYLAHYGHSEFFDFVLVIQKALFIFQNYWVLRSCFGCRYLFSLDCCSCHVQIPSSEVQNENRDHLTSNSEHGGIAEVELLLKDRTFTRKVFKNCLLISSCFLNY